MYRLAIQIFMQFLIRIFRKRKSRNWSVRSLAELNSLIEEEQVRTSTVENLLSKDPEARAKAAVDLLTRQNDSSLVDLIQDYVSS